MTAGEKADGRQAGLRAVPMSRSEVGVPIRPEPPPAEPKEVVGRMRLDLMPRAHPRCFVCSLWDSRFPPNVKRRSGSHCPGGRAVMREIHVRWLEAASYGALAAYVAEEAKERGWMDTISGEAIRQHFVNHVPYEHRLTREDLERWAALYPADVVAENLSNLPAAAETLLRKVGSYIRNDMEITSPAEAVMAARWAQAVLERAMQGRAAAEAVLSRPRLMMEVRRVIPQKFWPALAQRLEVVRGLPIDVLADAKPLPFGPELPEPVPQQMPETERTRAGKRLVEWAEAHRDEPVVPPNRPWHPDES
jgi:hypothetical protein